MGVVKRHVIHSIRDEPERRAPDGVFLKPHARPKALLDHWVPHDPAHRDPDLHTRRGAAHPDTSKEEKTIAANAGALVTNTYTTGLNRITSTRSPRSRQYMFLVGPVDPWPSCPHNIIPHRQVDAANLLR